MDIAIVSRRACLLPRIWQMEMDMQQVRRKNERLFLMTVMRMAFPRKGQIWEMIEFSKWHLVIGMERILSIARRLNSLYNYEVILIGTKQSNIFILLMKPCNL